MAITKVGAVIWTSPRVAELLAFYRAIGISLEPDTHDPQGGTTHFEADVGGTHFAVFQAAHDPIQSAGAEQTLIGFAVDDLDLTLDAIKSIDVPVRVPLEDTPWGKRVVVIDPDGRRVELYQPGAAREK